jgi:hypothetical protein
MMPDMPIELPPNWLDLDDCPQGLTGMARFKEARMAELEEAKAHCSFRAERRPINRHLHTLHDALRRCKTRTGYLAPS